MRESGRAWYLYQLLTLFETVKSKQLVLSWREFAGLRANLPGQLGPTRSSETVRRTRAQRSAGE